MCINAGVTHCADYRIIVSFPIINFFGQSNISHIELVPLLAVAHPQIIRLDISMNKAFGMNKLKAKDKLVRKHKYCLERELPTTVIQEIL